MLSLKNKKVKKTIFKREFSKDQSTETRIVVDESLTRNMMLYWMMNVIITCS